MKTTVKRQFGIGDIFIILVICVIALSVIAKVQLKPVEYSQSIGTGVGFSPEKIVEITIFAKPHDLVIMSDNGIELKPNDDGFYTLAPDDIHTIFIMSSTTIRYFTIEELETIQIKIGF